MEIKVGPKGEIIIPEELRKKLGIKPKSTIYLNLENRRIYIEPKKEDPAIIFKQIAEARPVTKKIAWDKSYEEEIEERWNKVKR